MDVLGQKGGRAVPVAVLLLGVVAWLALPAKAETRYHQHCAKAKGSGGAVKLIAATYFGGPSAEEFIAADWTSSGEIVAIGNAWGPDFPTAPKATVIGEELYTEADVLRDEEKLRLDYENPNIAAFVVGFNAKMDRVRRITRFGWGNAAAGKAVVADDGAVYLSGRCTPAFRQFVRADGLLRRVVSPPEGVEPSGADLYLARLAASGRRLEWALVFEGAEGWSAHWEGRQGDRDHTGIRVGERSDGSLVLVGFNRLYTLTKDGGTLTELGPTRGGALLAVEPRDDSVYLGSDENTNTGREPWRRPFLTKYDRTGEQVWEGWRWDSKLVGTDQYRLVSDSGIWGVAFGPDEQHRFVWGWSDGGNSVFSRQPDALDDAVNMKGSFIDSLWGAGVGKFSWFMLLDEETGKVTQGGNWCSFLVDRNKPNSSAVSKAVVLDDARIAFVGASSWALVETPDAWVRAFPEGSGGSYLAILSGDLRDLLFASLLPSNEGPVALESRDTSLLIACRARAPEPERPSILVDAVQPDFGGLLDAYALLVETESEED